MLTGLAACAAVWFAKDPVTTYLNKMSVVQTVVVNTCEAKKQVQELIEKSKDPIAFDKYFHEIPSELPKTLTRPMGIFISPEYREAAKSKVEAASSDEAKREILKSYWEKSLSKETKSNVDLRLNGDQ